MNTTEVDALVRGVIVHLGLPFAVLSVLQSPAGWNIQVRAGTGGVVRFTVAGGRPPAMRLAIQEKLEAALPPSLASADRRSLDGGG
jgi:hypothetical protein